MTVWSKRLFKKLQNLGATKLSLRNILFWTVVVIVIVGFSRLYPFNGLGEWTGFGKDSNKSVTIQEEIDPKSKKVLKITKKETENFQSAKTLWDWSQLLGTIAIPFALFHFEKREQERANKRSEQEKEIADNNLQEQILEAYIDKMSELLIDRELKVLINENLTESDPKYPLLDALLDIARARTLSILRRLTLTQDIKRIDSVFEFLADAELAEKPMLKGVNLSNIELNNVTFLNINLSEANLSEADLRQANLKGANLTKAELYRTKLNGANLKGADLSDSNLTRAILIGVYLNKTKLIRADLNEADLSGAILFGADLSGAILDRTKGLTSQQIESAKGDDKTRLPKGIERPKHWISSYS